MMQTLVVKIGTNVITREDGLLDLKILKQLTEELAHIQKQGTNVILVSSGAMGAGRSLIELSEKVDKVAKRQVLAAVGQVKLMQTYLELFSKLNSHCAQVLATKEDFRDRNHYLNMKQCFESLLENNVIPVVNENDVVSVDELMFTDNDELASMISSMLNADRLILLTSTDGLFTGHPDLPDSKPIREVTPDMNVQQFISAERSSFGRGGMLTKVKMAQKLSKLGISVHIAHGQYKGILQKCLSGEKCGTHFPAQVKTSSSLKRWIAYSEGYEKGAVHLNEKAEPALREKIASLLPVGITKLEGEFQKGDVLKIINANGEQIGFGVAAYGHESAKTSLGQKGKKALIHYDYLTLS